jgi:hypothetical protein
MTDPPLDADTFPSPPAVPLNKWPARRIKAILQWSA